MPLQTPLLAVLPAFLIAAVVLAALWRPWVRRDVARPAWAGALALGAAFVVADRLIWKNWPALWPAEEHRRLPMVALGAMLVAIADAARRGRIAASWHAWVAGAALTLPIMWADVSRPSTYPISLLFWLMYAGAVALLWSETVPAAARARGVRVPLVLCIAAAGAALTIIQSGFASGGFMIASVAAALAAFVAMAVWRPDLRTVAGAGPVYSALLVSILVCSTSTGVFSTILTVLSAATAGLGDRGPLARLKPWTATLLCVLLTMALAIASIALTPGGFDFSIGGAEDF